MGETLALAELDPWERINRLPEDKPLTSSEAAIFLTYSLATLERMRVNGTGPAYHQGGIRIEMGVAKGKRKQDAQVLPELRQGSNQHIRYFKSDIREWWAAGKVKSTMEAAQKKGQMFASLAELAEERAYILDPFGVIQGPAEAMGIEAFIEGLGSWQIEWLTAVEACRRRWSSLAAHQSFAGPIDRLLSDFKQCIASGIESTEIGLSLGEPSPAEQRRRRNRDIGI